MNMKFSTKFIIILFVVLLILAVFLYSLNDLTKKQQEEESRSEMFNSFNTDIYNLRDKHDQALLSDCPNLLIDKGNVLLLYNTTAVAENQLVKTFKNMSEYQQYVSEQQSAGKQCPLLYLRQEVTTQGQEVYRMYTEATMSPANTMNPSHIPSPEPAPTVGTTTIAQNMVGQGTAQGTVGTVARQEWGQQGRPPMPPPFLESVPIWDLHHQPPLYVEGGLPALPMERRPAGVIEARDAVTDTNPRFNQTGLNSYDPYGLYVGRFTDVDVLHKKTADASQGLSANAADPNWGGVMYTQQLVRDNQYSGSEVQRAIYPNLGFV